MKYHHLVLTSFAVISLLFLTACNGDESLAISETEARAQIMELHELQRTYHLEKMVEEFINQLSPNHISVNNGEIESPTKEELTQRFQNYFDAATFEKWDDLNPPIIKFSDDFSLAYTIVDKEVVVNYEDENGETVRESTKFSWVAIYKRYGEEWKIDCVASSNQPSEILE